MLKYFVCHYVVITFTWSPDTSAKDINVVFYTSAGESVADTFFSVTLQSCTCFLVSYVYFSKHNHEGYNKVEIRELFLSNSS